MKILVAEEKHGHRYFDASTPELLGKAALKLLKERFDGCQYELYNPSDKVVLSEDQIEKLPEPYKNMVLSERRHYMREMARYEKDVKFHQEVESALKSKDWTKSWKLLQFRRDREYENVYTEELEIAD